MKRPSSTSSTSSGSLPAPTALGNPTPWQRIIRNAYKLIAATLLISVPACQSPPPLLSQIQQDQTLVVGTLQHPASYYDRGAIVAGFEYRLAQQFADVLRVKLRVIEYQNKAALLQALDEGAAHIAAADITATATDARRYRFSSPYLQRQLVLVYHGSTRKPRSLDAIADTARLEVLQASPAAAYLESLQREDKKPNWHERYSASGFSLLHDVNVRNIDYAIVDKHFYTTQRNLFPHVRIAQTLPAYQPKVWVLAQNSDPSLFIATERFVNNAITQGAVDKLTRDYYGHHRFNYVDSTTLLTNMKERLPKYEARFKRAGLKYGLDWRLLAAVGYQESHWNPKAKSPTGVRGLMMLTRITAKEVNVTRRHDATQSIFGGAKYLSKLFKRLPDSIQPEHRMWFALAAYNVGYGHLMDARDITRTDKADPNNWFDVRKRLPLLQKKRFYKNVKYGFAEGSHLTPTYVRNIRRYYENLLWATHFKEEQILHTPQSLLARHKRLIY